MTLLTLILKNIARRPMRSALTAFGLSVATAAVVSLVGVSQRFNESFLELYPKRGSDFVGGPKGDRRVPATYSSSGLPVQATSNSRSP